MTETPLWTVDELLSATGGTLEGQVTATINGVAIDSRTIKPGDLFIAIKGERTDGHDYVDKALAGGAALAVVSHKIGDAGGPLLLVDDTLKAMEAIGRASRVRSNAKIIAVTGSVGKTSTKDALALALSKSGRTHRSVASFNNHWGVPLTLARMHPADDYAVFEIGMNHAGEIRELVTMVGPHIAIVTAVAESHLGHFDSIDGIARAKGEIFEGIEPGGAALINVDSGHAGMLREIAKSCGVDRVYGFGSDECADIRLSRSVLHASCSCVSARVLGEDVTFKLGMPGAHHVHNVLSVLGAVKLAGGDLARAALAMAELEPPSGRGVRHRLQARDGPFLLIDESYNANPASMAAALSLLAAARPRGTGRRVAVLGDMLELGEKSQTLHKNLAPAIEAARVDGVYACGTMMKALFDSLPLHQRRKWAPASDELEDAILDDIAAGDVVMVKGSLGSRMGPLVAAIKEKFKAPGEAAENQKGIG